MNISMDDIAITSPAGEHEQEQILLDRIEATTAIMMTKKHELDPPSLPMSPTRRSNDVTIVDYDHGGR